MIADIDFRWVKKPANDRHEDQSVMASHEIWTMKLQFRKFEYAADIPPHWTPWQDVPVVEE